ncbi:hypothetical protein RSSM_06356 [Rhodopirellula sallentina SM41]|uniref:Uncharacterized protein n=1 Tax=Rhodopirellula sallentina SM41 TaxID=1263870 RepID=M5TST0_9BACT|nr:hypothetical protein RSSM_06356 [Rhodopirellula sallentina SM41]
MDVIGLGSADDGSSITQTLGIDEPVVRGRRGAFGGAARLSGSRHLGLRGFQVLLPGGSDIDIDRVDITTVADSSAGCR